eukprot:TRINITY_DN14225_c0_g1_i1.p1 TRINITY_DN14225_c0_g1~~TRINITY_DN14225_c0_g1_i1.p1  ORF type:complete len:192 (-),score=21.63 TRINITY_DN14225_c0_g1_i1:91-618(-)
MPFKQFEVVGRHRPTEKNASPPIYRMKIFAPDQVKAESRFWYYMSLQKKVKRANGEVIRVSEIFDPKPHQVKNYGIWLRYDSRSGTHNMYKEFRDTTINGAIDKLYTEMASLHRVRRSALQIIRTAVVQAKDCRRPHTLQFHDSKIHFKLLHRIPRNTHKRHRSTFKAAAPSTFF